MVQPGADSDFGQQDTDRHFELCSAFPGAQIVERSIKQRRKV